MSSNEIKLHEAPDFSEFITDLVNGEVNQKLTATMAEVVGAVCETGLNGEVTLKLQIKKESGRAMVGVEIKKKVPEHPVHGTLFFFGNNGLVRDDPKQMKFKGLDAPKIVKD